MECLKSILSNIKCNEIKCNDNNDDYQNNNYQHNNYSHIKVEKLAKPMDDNQMDTSK